jgi:hypothetical protein
MGCWPRRQDTGERTYAAVRVKDAENPDRAELEFDTSWRCSRLERL